METVGGEVSLLEPVAFDLPIGDPSAPAKVPRRIRRRLLESSAAAATAEEIEAKLKDAAVRRQQFHDWLSSKARPKQRSTPWSSQEEDVGTRIQAKLYAAEQNRLSLLAKDQMRLARMDERRQAAKTCAEMRFEKERKELGTRVESRVQQAEENRMSLLKALKERWAATQERTAMSLLQRAIRENKYKECVHSAILQKRACAEKKRMGLLRARARVMQARRVAVTPSSTAEEIEAKLKDAALRRQQFHEWLSSKARPKQRSTPWSSQEEDVGRRIEAKLYAAEQKRLSLLAKDQMRLARLDGRRQAAKTCAEVRFEKERKELGTRVESRLQQAEENRMRLLKAHKQRWAATQERTARSLLQRAIRENKYKECVHSAILQKRACAEKKRMGLLRARARVMQARRVAKNVCKQRENEQRRAEEQLENRHQKSACTDAVRAACHDLSLGMRVIEMQVMEDQKLLHENVLHLSGPAGIERMECALSGTRSKFFEGKGSADPLAGLPVHVPSLPLSSSSTEPQEPVHKKTSTETNEPSHAVAVHSPTTTGKLLPTENELLVNEIVHGGVGTTNNYSNSGDAYDIKAKVKVTMEKAFWDGVMESLKQREPDNGRVVKLVKEVRDELCEMAPQSWKQEILDSFDLDILSQVLESGTQDTDHLGRILEYALVMLQKLSAPANEDDVKKSHKELQNELAGIAQTDGKCNSSFVLPTVMGLRFVLEQIQILKKEISKARIQLVEPVIKGSAGLEYLQKAFADRYGHPPSSANSLPLTVRWISSLGTRLEEDWNEHTHSLSALPTTYGLPPVTSLRTGGSIPSASKHSSIPVNASDGSEKKECNGEKVDILVRLGLLELASGIEGVTVDTVPETFKHNALRLRAVQGQLQKIIVFSTSMLVLRQILISENVALTPSIMDSILSDSFKRLSELIDRMADARIEEIVDAVAGSSVEAKLHSSKEMIARLLTRSLQSDDAVFTRVSRSIYLAARGIVLGGSGARGRMLADAALQRVGGSMLLDLVVKAAEPLIVMAEVSARVHGPWYRSLVSNFNV